MSTEIIYLNSEKELPLAVERLCGGATGGVCTMEPNSPHAIFPGSFAPLHEGHRQIVDHAQEVLDTTLAFEISIVNVDKAAVEASDILQRVKQFSATSIVYLTRAATFLEKSRLFPETRFAVGADTIVRIADPAYYADQKECDNAIAEILGNGCRFLVYGRTIRDQFRTLGELNLSEKLLSACRAIPESEFRADISSTEIRGL